MKPPFPAVVDSSMMNAFRACPRQAYLTYMEHWKSRSPNVHLHAGKAFARGLEMTRRAFFDAQMNEDEAIALGFRALIEEYGAFDCPPDSPKSLERLAGAFEYYFDVWPLASDSARPLKLPSGAHAIEFSFAVPLPIHHPATGDPILFVGRSDMIVQLEGGIFVEDDKTTSYLGASWQSQWDLRAQFSAYVWAARESGIPVDGVLVRGISITKTKYDHSQYITFRPQWEIDRWLHQTVRDIQRWIRCWEEGYYDFNLGESCTSYGGCAFSSICKKENPDEWLPTYFEKRIWNPLTRQETAQ